MNENNQPSDPHQGGNAMSVTGGDASGAALAARAAREIEAALTIAAARPRDEIRAALKIQNAVKRPRMAEDAIYSFPRGRETITGPSVALARVLAQCWGNIRYGVDELPTATGHIHLKGWAWDLEANTRVEAEDRFERLIPKATGQRDARGKKITHWVEPDERDLRELKNRRAAFLLRNALLQLMPSDIVEDALATARQTSASVAAGDLKARPQDTIRAIAAAFADLGVGVDAIERKLGHPITEIGPDELATLRGTYKALRDGQVTRDEAFPRPQAAQAAPVDDPLSRELAGAKTQTHSLGAAPREVSQDPAVEEQAAKTAGSAPLDDPFEGMFGDDDDTTEETK